VIDDDDGKIEIRPSRKGREDFHNRVTTKSSIDIETEEPVQYGKGVLKTLLMLLAVVALGTFLFRNTLKLPTADELYTKIQSSNAQSVIEEAETFIENYPDDERIENVKRICEFGKATKYYSQLKNKLGATKNFVGEDRLSIIENQFLKIANLAETNFEAANSRMDAFVTLHDSNPNLTDRDRKCVDAAKSFRLKIRQDAIKRAKTSVDSIRHALKNAAESDPKEAMAFYESIIELYGSMNENRNPEVQSLVSDAQKGLEDLRAGKRRTPQKPSTSESENDRKLDE
jgi:serine/threonine-protein kinase